jgi:lipopolysaccharide/colanic/teichoic acid biosynthesis glycosyltransferase
VTPAYQQIFALNQTQAPPPLRHGYRLERVVATAALIAVAPLLLQAAVVIAVLSRRSPLVRHTRVGWRGVEVPMLKFRTMQDRNGPHGPIFAIENISSTVPLDKTVGDDRVTSRFAAWCRPYSIDKLPQLFHVARGETSFVGPRPTTRIELEQHYGASTESVISLRPGLTGLWRTMGRSRLTYARRERLDLLLVRSASPRLYSWILFSTVPKVLRGHDAH